MGRRCPRCAELTAMWQKEKQCSEHFGDPIHEPWICRLIDWILRSPKR